MAEQGTDPGRLRAGVAVLTTPGGAARLDDLLASGEDLRAVPDGRDGDALAAADHHAGRWAALGVRVCLRGDAAWPDLRCASVPPLLARRGSTAGRRPAVAIVGARRASAYGRGVAGWLAGAASAAGVVVVSGGAVGIDAAAHTAALDGDAPTTVVLGCGHDVRYPAAHARTGGLFGRVVEEGGTLVSERLPDGTPHPGAVRARNRLVAGLVDAVVVVEGGSRSGSLLTASAAAELGVPVLAVPGEVRAPGSVAPHRLLAEGAAPCTGPEDLLAALPTAVQAGGTVSAEATSTEGAGTRERLERHVGERVAARIAGAWPRPLPVDVLVTDAPGGVVGLLRALERARADGLVELEPGGVRLDGPPT